jgi:signal transduction histidine kinase
VEQQQIDELRELLKEMRGVVAATSSVGDAIASIEKNFPGWLWSISNHNGPQCILANPDDGTAYADCAETIQEAVFNTMDKAKLARDE